MSIKQTLLLSFSGLLVIVGALFLGFIFLIPSSTTLPPDTEMAKRFFAHEAEFNQVVEMCEVDSRTVRIPLDLTGANDDDGRVRSKRELESLTRRREEYSSLFIKLGLLYGVLNYQPDMIEFIDSDSGPFGGGSSKGFAYCPKQPSLIVDSLDNPNLPRSQFIFKPLKDNWYLVIDNR